jgi:membrane protein required for colicin V production
MNSADIAVAAVIILCGIIALRIGLVRVSLGLAGWVGATFATIYGYSYARPFAREWIGNELIADIVAGAAIFIVSMLVLTFISHAIAGGVRNSAFGMLDRTFGLLVGLAIGSVAASGGYIFSQQVLQIDDNSKFYQGAKSLPLLKRGADILASVAPSELGIKRQSVAKKNRDDTFRSLLSPRLKPNNLDRQSGYKSKERREMDRLINSHQ